MAEVHRARALAGKFEHQIDEANRLVVPARLRDRLDGILFLSLGKGEHPHLVLLPEAEYDRFVAKLDDVDPFGESQSDIRDMFGDAFEVSIDSQGRLALPGELRKSAKLGQKVVILGAFNRVEIWDREIFRDYRQARGLPE